MGFGNGYSVRHDRGSKRYTNDMVAHIWAQGDPDASGQSGNGNFFFNGRDLWSYGSHYLVGRIMSDGTALLNSESNSVTTAGHQSDASGAARHRDRFYIGDLTALHDVLRELDRNGRKADRKSLRAALVKHAHNLRRCRNQDRWQDEGEGEQAGAYLARLGGLPAASWGAIVRERERLDKAAAKASASKAAKEARARAIRYADMTGVEWRELMRKDSSKYEYFYAEHAKRLYHAVRLAKAEGFSAKRRAILKDRRADALRRKAGYDGAEASYRRWQPIRQAILKLQSARDVFGMAAPYPVTTRQNAVDAARSCLAQLSLCGAFPQATRERMREQSEALKLIAEAMSPDVDAYRIAERERQAAEYAERERLAGLKREEQIAAWHDGADVRVTFDAESGGAAIRIRGDQLETSHGASVPLEHAVKAFRFVKLVRQRGTAWERNGKTIRVGHFQIDRISENGDFRAGCHSFTWPEVERAAALAGVLEAEASDSAVVPSAN